jgi:hypothetical protein
VDLVFHSFAAGQRILDAYDVKSGRLLWRRTFLRDGQGRMKVGYEVYTAWTELDGVLFPERVIDGTPGRERVDHFADYQARVPWATGEQEVPEGLELLAPNEPVTLHPDAAAAMALPEGAKP